MIKSSSLGKSWWNKQLTEAYTGRQGKHIQRLISKPQKAEIQQETLPELIGNAEKCEGSSSTCKTKLQEKIIKIVEPLIKENNSYIFNDKEILDILKKFILTKKQATLTNLIMKQLKKKLINCQQKNQRIAWKSHTERSSECNKRS